MTYSGLSYIFTEAFKDWIKLLKRNGEFSHSFLDVMLSCVMEVTQPVMRRVRKLRNASALSPRISRILAYLDRQLRFTVPAASASSVLAGGWIEIDHEPSTMFSYFIYSPTNCRGFGDRPAMEGGWCYCYW